MRESELAGFELDILGSVVSALLRSGVTSLSADATDFSFTSLSFSSWS